MDGFLRKQSSKLGGFRAAASVGPSDDFGERRATTIGADKAVPKTGDAHSCNGASAQRRSGARDIDGLRDAFLDGLQQHGWI